jgi:hypothetical protein
MYSRPHIAIHPKPTLQIAPQHKNGHRERAVVGLCRLGDVCHKIFCRDDLGSAMAIKRQYVLVAGNKPVGFEPRTGQSKNRRVDRVTFGWALVAYADLRSTQSD